MSEKEAKMTLEGDIPTSDLVHSANVVISTQWETEYTKEQVNPLPYYL